MSFSENTYVSDGQFKIAAKLMKQNGYDLERTPNAKKALVLYLAGRSLFLAGSTGAGKTMFFKAIGASRLGEGTVVIYSLNENRGKFTSVITDEIRALNDYEVVIDDVGTEGGHNGRDDEELLSRIMAIRERSIRRTHYTSNLTGQQIKERYDERVRSRLRCCMFIPMLGNDNRSVTTNPKRAALIEQSKDSKSWILCSERCPKFVDGKCQKGVQIAPYLLDLSPENSCGVGDKIPYKPEYVEAEAKLKEFRRKILGNNCLHRV